MGFGVSTVATIATRPVDLTVAVAVEDETTVYVLGIMSMLLLETEGTRVTLLAYSQDGSLLAVASSDFEDEYGLLFDPRVEVWNIRGDMISTIYSEGDAINAVGFNSDNNRILVSDFVQGYVGNDVSYWELDGTSPLWRYWDMIDNLPTPSINDPLLVMTVAMHGDIAAFGGVDGYYNDRNFYGLAVHLWDVETQQRQLEIVVSRQREDEDIYTVSGPALAFSADGMILATAQSGGIIELWDTVDGSKMNEIDTELDDIFQLAFSWDDALLAALTEDDLIVIDVAEMRVIASYEAVTSEG
jgi:WD40 repeat protein